MDPITPQCGARPRPGGPPRGFDTPGAPDLHSDRARRGAQPYHDDRRQPAPYYRPQSSARMRSPAGCTPVIEKIEAGDYGLTDTREAYSDAVDLAMADQTRAGIDIISDGEMRRWMFVQNFYDHITGIVEEPLLRTVGPYGYDSPRRYRAVEKVQVPDGLGIVEEFKYARSRTGAPLKATCPGPITLSMHIRPGSVYPTGPGVDGRRVRIDNQLRTARAGRGGGPPDPAGRALLCDRPGGALGTGWSCSTPA